MGAHSFWVNVRGIPLPDENILAPYRKYIRIFPADGEFCLEGALVSFLPACEMMHRLLTELAADAPEAAGMMLESAKNEFPAGLPGKTAFIAQMYGIWAEKLAGFYAEWGAFLVPPDAYFDTRDKLTKLCKYYQKIPGEGKEPC